MRWVYKVHLLVWQVFQLYPNIFTNHNIISPTTICHTSYFKQNNQTSNTVFCIMWTQYNYCKNMNIHFFYRPVFITTVSMSFTTLFVFVFTFLFLLFVAFSVVRITWIMSLVLLFLLLFLCLSFFFILSVFIIWCIWLVIFVTYFMKIRIFWFVDIVCKFSW